MKRVIVDYSKLTNEILNLLVDKFPEGYDDSDIISFKNAKGEIIDAVEVRTEDTIFLVKVSTKLATRIENFEDDEDEALDIVIPEVSLDKIKDLDITDDEDDEDDDKKSKEEEEDDDEDEDEDGNSKKKKSEENDDDDDED